MSPKTRTRIAVSPTGTAAAAKIHELKQPEIIHKAKRTSQTAGEWVEQANFVESPKKTAQKMETKTASASGGSSPPRVRKGKRGDKFFFGAYLDQKSKQSNVHHVNLSNSLIHKPSANLPPNPIYLDYKVQQVGNSSQLDKFRKMYKATKIELDVPSQYVGGTASNSRNRLRNQTFAGLNRKNIHLPHLYFDYTDNTTPKKNLTAAQSLFNRGQIENALEQMYLQASQQASPAITPSFADWLKDIYEPAGEANRYGLPVGDIKCHWKLLNRNVATNLHLSIYLCTPKRKLKAVQNPANCWVNFWKGADDMSDAERSVMLDPAYRFNPILQADYDTMGSSGPANTQDPNVNTISIFSNRDQVQTVSSEVALNISPYMSQEFKNNWSIVTVNKVMLLPQQTLHYNMEFLFSKILDMKEYFSDGALSSEKYYFYPDESIVPLFCFYGSETAAESKFLQRNTGTGPAPKIRNLAQESTTIRTAPCCLSQELEQSMTVYGKEIPQYTMSSTHPLLLRSGIELLMENLTSQTRYVMPAEDPQRGIQVPYHFCNDSVVDFFDKPSWIDGTHANPEYANTIVEVDTKTTGNATPTNAEPPVSSLSWASTDIINSTTVDTVARTQVVKTESDIIPSKN